MATSDVRDESFPAPSRQANGQVNGIPTDVSCINFADKIVITICQDGRLAQWVRIQIDTSTSKQVNDH